MDYEKGFVRLGFVISGVPAVLLFIPMIFFACCSDIKTLSQFFYILFSCVMFSLGLFSIILLSYVILFNLVILFYNLFLWIKAGFISVENDI